MHTPESIEALPKEGIADLRRLTDELHQATAPILDTPLSSADIERELRLRTAMKLKLDESMGWLAEQIANLEGVKRDLRTKKGYQTTDEDRLQSYFFNRLKEEKRGNA